jgi:hypothetical protein
MTKEYGVCDHDDGSPHVDHTKSSSFRFSSKTLDTMYVHQLDVRSSGSFYRYDVRCTFITTMYVGRSSDSTFTRCYDVRSSDSFYRLTSLCSTWHTTTPHAFLPGRA